MPIIRPFDLRRFRFVHPCVGTRSPAYWNCLMLALRSFLFNVAFYANLILRMIGLSPIYFLLPRKKAYSVPRAWARSNIG